MFSHCQSFLASCMKIPENTNWVHGRYSCELDIQTLKSLKNNQTYVKCLLLLIIQVPTCFNSNVQRLGSGRQICTSHQLPQVGVEEGPVDCDSKPFPTSPCILLHSEVWGSSHFILRIEQRPPYSLCPYCST